MHVYIHKYICTYIYIYIYIYIGVPQRRESARHGDPGLRRRHLEHHEGRAGGADRARSRRQLPGRAAGRPDAAHRGAA